MQTFKPSSANYRRYVIGLIPITVLIVIIDFARNPSNPFLVGGLVIAAAVVVAVYMLLYFRNSQVDVEPHLLTVRNTLGRVHTYTRTDLDRVLLLHNVEQRAGYTYNSGPRMMVLNTAGKSVLTWYYQLWTVQQMGELAHLVGVPVDEISETLSMAALKKRYPHSVSWVAAHPWRFAFIIVAVILIIVVVSVLVAVGAQD